MEPKTTASYLKSKIQKHISFDIFLNVKCIVSDSFNKTLAPFKNSFDNVSTFHLELGQVAYSKLFVVKKHVGCH